MIYRLILVLLLSVVAVAAAKPFDYQKFSDYATHKVHGDWGLAGMAFAIVEDGKITLIQTDWAKIYRQHTKPLTEKIRFFPLPLSAKPLPAC
jgi:CubicO group peptidase (beta-lactamase class C family)